MAKYGSDRRKVTGTTILGRYLSKMKLKQFRDYRWKDTQALQEVAEKRLRETMEKQGKDKGEIALMIEEQRQVIPEVVEEPDYAESDPNAQYGGQFSFGDSTESADDLGLTDDDIIYLKLK